MTASLSLIVAAGLTVSLLDYDPPTGAVVVVSVALLAFSCCRTSWGTAPRCGSAGRCSASGCPARAAGADLHPLTVVVAVAGTTLLFLLARWGIALAAVTVGVLWSTWLIGTAPPDPRWFFGLAGVGLFAFSLRKGSPLAWFAALFVRRRSCCRSTKVPFFEVPTLVLAGLLLLAGLSSSGPASAAPDPLRSRAERRPAAQRDGDLGRIVVDAVTGTVSARDARRRRVLAAGVRATPAGACRSGDAGCLDRCDRPALGHPGHAAALDGTGTGRRGTDRRGRTHRVGPRKRQETSAWLRTLQ